MPPIHIPAWPVSTTTIASSGTCFDSSWQMRAGLIGAASDSSIGLYLAYHSLTIDCACSTQALRLPAVDLSQAANIFASVTLASPLTRACSG